MKKAKSSRGKPLQIGGQKVYPGERKKIYINVAALYDYTDLNLPIEVVRGKESGPVMFISAAIHGDEINGVEIIKRLLHRRALSRIKGTLIAIPVVNVFGFTHKSRYLPDRRDLNRCFPGSATGSLGARLAHIFMTEIVRKCTHGIDLHTGSNHRTNLPQIRANLSDQETLELAKGFGVPVIIDAQMRDGSLREAASRKKVVTLLYEGGESLRFEEGVVNTGLRGCLSVMTTIGMLPPPTKASSRKPSEVFVAKGSYWVRTPHSGSFRSLREIGDRVKAGETLAVISDPFGCTPFNIDAEAGGIIIGMSTIPLVNRGDAVFHIARFEDSKKVKEALVEHEDSLP